MFDNPAFDNHENLHFFNDSDSGLRAIIAIHSTRLGPAAGGTRMWHYPDTGSMVTDALRLSQGMSYKNAMAAIPHGGGKAVICAHPKTDKSDALFKAYGRAVNSLQGRYCTAGDVGINPADIAIIAGQTAYAAGKAGGVGGDSGPATALGVYRGIRQAALRAFGTDDLSGRTVAVQGVGSVGGRVCGHLAKAGARLIVCDVDRQTAERVARRDGARIVDPDEIDGVDADIFSPNALGAVINEDSLKRLKVKVVAGGANNQLANDRAGEILHEAGIVYAPDFVVNGGGIINIASELSGAYSPDWVTAKLDALMVTLGEVLDESLKQARPGNLVANDMARARIAAGGQS